MMRVRGVLFWKSEVWVRGGLALLALALGVLIPRLGLPQVLTGPLVNALLIVSVEVSGVGAALLVGAVTPFSALLSGVLPLPLLATLPLIALGNALLVLVYAGLRRRGYWVGVLVAAVVKFAWLYAAVGLLAARLPGEAVLPATLLHTLQWPQLATALAGGLIASVVLRCGAFPQSARGEPTARG